MNFQRGKLKISKLEVFFIMLFRNLSTSRIQLMHFTLQTDSQLKNNRNSVKEFGFYMVFPTKILLRGKIKNIQKILVFYL